MPTAATNSQRGYPTERVEGGAPGASGPGAGPAPATPRPLLAGLAGRHGYSQLPRGRRCARLGAGNCSAPPVYRPSARMAPIPPGVSGGAPHLRQPELSQRPVRRGRHTSTAARCGCCRNKVRPRPPDPRFSPSRLPDPSYSDPKVWPSRPGASVYPAADRPTGSSQYLPIPSPSPTFGILRETSRPFFPLYYYCNVALFWPFFT